MTSASLRERLLAGDLEDVRGVVESLAKEFDVLDIAAAAVRVAQAAMNGASTDPARVGPAGPARDHAAPWTLPDT